MDLCIHTMCSYYAECKGGGRSFDFLIFECSGRGEQAKHQNTSKCYVKSKGIKPFVTRRYIGYGMSKKC